MSNEHKYILEPYKGMSTRHRCPVCNKDRVFSLYIDTEKGEHIAGNVGRCNRESNCGYHYTPKQYFQDNNISFDTPKTFIKKKAVALKPLPVSYTPKGTLLETLKGYHNNSFTEFLYSRFGINAANELIGKYFVGSSNHWRGATVFWQIDVLGRIRAGKIMLYNPGTGKRVKEPYNHITWAHKALNTPEYNLSQCLFGEHLLRKDPGKPVAVVESEKTAIISSLYLPQFIWLACGSIGNLNAERCRVLAGRKVILYPDLNGFEKWSAKAKELAHITTVTVSTVLEKIVTNEAERKAGLDIADYLLRYKPEAFKEPKEEPLQPVNILISNILSSTETITGQEFNNMRIMYVKTDDGKAYDLLFDNGGNAIGQHTQAVGKLAVFFCKDFKQGTIDGERVLINVN
ncbi:DUF6371 domain-containing protein [Agriterribacter humi]|uniref:DUF6371 domain-containing protein n=1 Tax=Agriterribacter humi TaxID=1104781 RepID=UPI0012646D27|nr:DUF6371 domain-containing protein [Agriterribacter humi]